MVTESIGDLTVDGCLYLEGNKLLSLPESFVSLTVGGHLDLSRNQLDPGSLPESFRVDGDLYLNNNNLVSLPESFGSLTFSGNLYLDENQLVSLPASFGSLTVGGRVYLCGNPVAASLDERSFPGLTLVLTESMACLSLSDDDY